MDTTTSMWDFVINNIKSILNEMCPLKDFKIRNSGKPWITNELLEQIRDKDRALRRAKRSSNPEYWKIARRLRNDCLRDVRNAKSDYIKNELLENQNDSKKFWQQINAILPKGKGADLINLIDGITGIPVKDNDVQNFINDYFSTIGSKLAENFNMEWTYTGRHCDIEIMNISTNSDEVLKLTKEIDITKSSAIDYISSRIIKDFFSNFPNTITKVFNHSLHTGFTPTSWKSATIIPLKKEGNSPDVNNLRPISLLPIQGKLLEKIVHNRIMSHLDENELLDRKQGGFRQNHSTIDTIVQFTEDLYKNINQGLFTVATFIEFRKAFDTVNYGVLVNRLNELGVRGNLLKWIQNYLKNRTLCEQYYVF